MMTYQTPQPADAGARATLAVVVDLSQHSRSHADSAIGKLVAECDREDLQFLFIVAGPLVDLDDHRVTLVEAGAGFDAVERISLALQLVSAERALVASTSVELRAETVDQADQLLGSHDLVDLHVLTRRSGEHEVAPFQSSRTVVIGIHMAMYVELRGFDLRIRTLRDGVDDFARRVRAWEGTVGALSCPEVIAFEPERIEKAAPQPFDTTKAIGVFVNLPRWKYRPFAAAPSISIVRTGGKSGAPFDGAYAQSLDGYDVVDVDSDPRDEHRALLDYLGSLGSRLVAIVAPGAAVPPWRLLEQIQHLRTAGTYCVGRAALLGENDIRLLPNGARAQPLLSPSVAELGTVMGRADVLLALTDTGPSRPTTRAQSSRIVSCLRPAQMPALAISSTPSEASNVAPYLDLAGSRGEYAIVFDQFTVGKVDYIDAYTRIGSIGVLIESSGAPRREITAVLSPTQADVDALAAEGLMFSLVLLDEDIDSVGVVVRELLGRFAGGSMVLARVDSPVGGCPGTQGSHPAYLFIREGTGREAWFGLNSIQEASDVQISRDWRKSMLELDLICWEA